MSWVPDLYRSALGKKAAMAVSGILLFGFVLAHMVGNLKVYQGPEKLNHYAEALRTLGAPFLGYGQALWVARALLLVAVGVHIAAAYQLTVMSRRARDIGYHLPLDPPASTYASRTMRWGGVVVGLFVVYHILHLTTGAVHPDFHPGDVYHNFVVGFRDPLVAAFYVLAQVALGFHLYHGLWSLFQTLGSYGPRLNRFRKGFAVVFALVVALGNISFPVAVLTGVLR